MELRTQVAIQLMLTACRFLLVISMITSIAFATFYIHEDKQLVVSSSSLNVLDYNTSGIKFMLPISVQSMIFHHSIPNLIRLVHSTAETDIISIFGIAISICLVLYMSLAIAAFSYFGQSIKSSSNLNWVVFISQPPTSPTTHWLMRCISSFIILYPAINVISSFPLNAITLGNSLQFFFLKESSQNEYSIKLLFRIIASLPPIVLAANIRLLGVISTYTGLFGFAIMFIYPAVLSHCSIKALRRRNGLEGITSINTASESHQWMQLYRQLTDSHTVIITMLSTGVVCSLCLLTALIWL